jgi:predicted DNA-binding transcriptional regulator YafY
MLRMVLDLQRSPQGRILVSRVAEKLEVHERTVSRWLNALSDAFVDEYGEAIFEKKRIGNRAYAVLNRDIVTSSSIYFYAAVHVAMQNISAIRQQFLSEFGEQVKEDIREHALETKPHLRTQFERVDDVFAYVPFGPKDYKDQDEELGALMTAAMDRKECVIKYEPAGREPEDIRIRPLCVILYRDGLYLRVQAWRREAWRMRTFALDRVLDVERTNVEFRRPNGFKTEDVAKDRLGLWSSEDETTDEVELFFASDAFERASERQWPGQLNGWERSDCGRHALRLELPITPEFVTWLLTWGPKVEVTSPEWLRDELRDAYADALELYI